MSAVLQMQMTKGDTDAQPPVAPLLIGRQSLDDTPR